MVGGTSNSNGTVLIRGLLRVGIEVRVGQLVRDAVVHGYEHVAAGNGQGYECLGTDASSLRFDDDIGIGPNGCLAGIGRVNFDVDVFRIEFAQHTRFASSGLRMPLGYGATSGEQQQWELRIRQLRHSARRLVDKASATVGMIEAAVCKESSLVAKSRGGSERGRWGDVD